MKRKTEFSKRILAAIAVFWLLGAVLGGVLSVWAAAAGNFAPLDSVLTYIGAPMAGGVVGYMIKSAGENKEKIRRDRGSRGT